jgi:hypothetical protein
VITPQQAPGCLGLLVGGILIEVELKGGQARTPAGLGHLAEAPSSLMGGGEGGAAGPGLKTKAMPTFRANLLIADWAQRTLSGRPD